MTHRKKCIEVALPLEAINRESVRESYISRPTHLAFISGGSIVNP